MAFLEFTLNGQPIAVYHRPGESLLEVLRERCHITSVKNGCSPQGQCGACLALIDGRAVTTCAMPAGKAAGAHILTLEGLSEAERTLLGEAFVAAAGLQCGFCIPAIALHAKHLIEKQPYPTRAQIAAAIDVHLCRCTGYVKIIDAIELYARARRGEAVPTPVRTGGVGDRVARYHGQELALGTRPFIADMQRPGMLYGALVLAQHPRARVVRIDVSRARALPGVMAVATAREVPGARWYGLIEHDWPGFVAEGEEVRCVGDVVAAIAAQDEHTARQAARLVDIDYEVLDPVLDPEHALAPGAPQVNPHHPNLVSHTVIRRGDIDAAFARSAHVVEGRWSTQRVEHLFLETECALAEPTAAGIKLYSQGQGIFDDRRQVAAFLGVPADSIDIELVAPGGAFGGKEDLTIQAHAALLCHLTGRPVRVELDRVESIRMHPKRHPMTLEYQVGCDAEGRLTAVRARMVGDTGAYASVGAKVLERAAGHACGAYRVDCVAVDALAVATNNPPCGAMRGFGVGQAHVAMEGCMDLLAAKVGIDGWQMRWRNAVRAGDAVTTGQVLDGSVGLHKTLEAVAPAYYQARERGRAVGIACGIKNTGIGNGAIEQGKARLVVERDGTISIYVGYTEMGQGLFTVLTQCAAEVTGVPAGRFRCQVDSRFELGSGQTTASRGTLLAGRAVVAAATKLAAALTAGATLRELAGQVFAGDIEFVDTTDMESARRAEALASMRIKTHISYGFATQVVILDERGHIERVIAAHDVGRAINPALCEGQIQGAIHMGLGYALTEELPCTGGWPVTYKLRELGILRARDMPLVEVVLIEEPEPAGPFGAKGLGEIGLVPTAAAVGGALAGFDGIRRWALPMKDSPAARAMSVGRIRPGRHV